MKVWDAISKGGKPPTLENIYSAPAHLLRRCHQISVALFADELGQYGLTPVQYASLLAIRDHPGIDQRGLGNAIAIDRSTITTVLQGLESRSLIRRETPSDNLRIKQLFITPGGEKLLSRTVAEISRVQQRILSPLSAKDQETFMRLISRLAHVNNELSRVPLRQRSAGGGVKVKTPKRSG